MKISVIIPTYQEAENISALIHFLQLHGNDGIAEIIVSDGGSTDDTIQVAGLAGAKTLLSPVKGRSGQMNYGVSFASGDILYFIHADTFPPTSFVNDIQRAVADGYAFGRYRTKFNSRKWLLKLNAFFTRFDLFVCYGGDQTLFMTRQLFEETGGFDTAMLIMEDYDMVHRAKARARYSILRKSALVSARKYDTNSWWQVLKANYTIIQLFKKGASQQHMVDSYKRMLTYR
ncbi:TIGR04283 family arsenosugar biosynthesis glycosyltransferase [Asinibacterium sp. OR53]|uniref:TIGR04283 family arsenosugar biosynthesis glycosyltransferase n=1 Tax=Asinibacterium sp. OR53 TaxID=925409 RepID=UPI00047D98EC|nr:TIGR04283 family arsenosugar biosynthesis glycosyltransferase [Asinibacterium sp. OR53]